MQYKTLLQENNSELRSLIEMASNLPDKGSGGGQNSFAVIGVIYPSGSTLTCTNGIVTLTAETTSGNWGFVIPSAGIWTVTATDGTDTASETVAITAEGQFVNVELSYWNGELYDTGNEFTDVTGGWVADALGQQTGGWKEVAPTLTKGSASMTVQMSTKEGNGCVHMENSVDMSKFTTLEANISGFSGGTDIVDQSYMSIYKKGNNPYHAAAAKITILSAGTFTLDIGALSGEYDVAFGCANNTKTMEYSIEKVRLR